jgi:hypothetical protein
MSTSTDYLLTLYYTRSDYVEHEYFEDYEYVVRSDTVVLLRT